MRISVYPENSSIAGQEVFAAFTKSLMDDNQNVVYETKNSDVAVIWSVLWNGRMAANKSIWNYYRSRNKPVIVLEVGALHRNKTWKVGINGINRDAVWIDSFGDTRHGLTLKPWREDGKHIIVCGQHGASEQWKGMPPVDEWMLNITRKIKSKTNRKVILRPHPRFPVSPDYIREFNNVLIAKPKKINGSYDDFNFEEALEGCWAVVNHSSGPATTAVMQGVPVFVSSHSLARDVGLGLDDLDRIEDPAMPDREDWLNKISYTEWTVDEIASGIVWKKLKEKLSCMV